MKLIVGLGNPGYEYALTPHNLGFMAVDRLAEECGVEVTRSEGQAFVACTEIERVPVVLAKPQTYMNLSGLAVARLVEKHGLAAQDLIVLLDDLDLPLGTLRIRARGSAGSHNGLKSVIGAIHSGEFARVRMGIHPDHPLEDRVSFVLSPFRKKDQEAVADVVEKSAEAVRVILREGISRAMNRYNRRNPSPES